MVDAYAMTAEICRGKKQFLIVIKILVIVFGTGLFKKRSFSSIIEHTQDTRLTKLRKKDESFQAIFCYFV